MKRFDSSGVKMSDRLEYTYDDLEAIKEAKRILEITEKDTIQPDLTGHQFPIQRLPFWALAESLEQFINS